MHIVLSEILRQWSMILECKTAQDMETSSVTTRAFDLNNHFDKMKIGTICDSGSIFEWQRAHVAKLEDYKNGPSACS